MLIMLSIIACTLLVICIIAMIIYKTYHNNILARLGKPLPYNDQFMDSPALRTGTYTVDHLKLTTIVGMSFINYYFVKLMTSFLSHLFNIKITKYMFRVLFLCKL